MNSRRDLFQAGALAGAAFLGARRAGAQEGSGPTQDVQVYIEEGHYKARGQIDGRVLISSASADEAIQHAIDSFAGQGGAVCLERGRFVVNRQINLAADVTLCGKGAASRLWIGPRHDTGVALFAGDTQDVTVADLSIGSDKGNERARCGVVLESVGVSTVRDVLCIGLQERGIWLRRNSFLCEVRGCKIGGAGKSGIFLDGLAGKGRGGDFVPNLVTNCIVYAGGTGIEANHTIVANIVGCEVFQSGGPAFHIHTQSNSVLVSGCRSFQIQDDAVRVEESHEVNISSNIFCWHVGHGIVLRGAIWGTITGNNVIDTGSINKGLPPGELPESIELKNAIYLSGTQGIGVTGNTIFNWPAAPPMLHGIFEDAACRNSIFTSNNINYAKKDVVSLGQGSKANANVSYLPEPFVGRHPAWLQTFDPHLMELLMEQQRGRS